MTCCLKLKLRDHSNFSEELEGLFCSFTIFILTTGNLMELSFNLVVQVNKDYMVGNFQFRDQISLY